MKSKVAGHTPGPWHLEPKISDHGASLVICDEGKEGILAVIPPLNDADEPDHTTAKRGPNDEANGRLMAAAPDCYEAMLLLEKFVESIMPQIGGLCCDIGLLNDALIAAGKAKGKVLK